MSLRAPPARGRARSWRGAASPVFVLVPGRLGPLARAGGHGSGRTSEAARDEADLGAVRSRRIVAVHGEIAMALGGRPLFARALFRAASASSSRQSTAHISARANSHSTCGVIRRRKVANDRYNIGVTSGSSTFPPGGDRPASDMDHSSVLVGDGGMKPSAKWSGRARLWMAVSSLAHDPCGCIRSPHPAQTSGWPADSNPRRWSWATSVPEPWQRLETRRTFGPRRGSRARSSPRSSSAQRSP